ncbi:hypothetical protein lerEdw1_019937 [Lerista edwardsae]|nr:hypothetical protein lerEdw1_019937 [Lerista edwardsae]
MAMFNPRGNMPPRPRGPNAPGPRGSFHGPEPGPGGPQRHGMPQRFMGPDMRAGFPRPNVQVTQHRTDPRQAREKVNVQRQQKEEGHTTRWDTPLPPGNNSQNQPGSGRIAEQTTSVQSRYTNESASSILASFGLSNEDLEELSRYPDDQLTPENMPLILRDIRIHKMTRNLPSLPSQTREKASFSKDDGHGSVVKSKVIDYGHESKYGYTKSPLDVKVYSSDVPNEQSMKGFQAQETAATTTTPSSVPSNTLNAVEELIRQMGFQRSTPATQPFFSMDTANKVPGLCLPSAGHVVPPAVQPMMPPVVSPMPQPVAQQALPPPPVVQPMMPAMNQPPPTFVPEILEAVNRHGRIQCESRGNPPHGPMSSQKTFQKETENPIESPFGVVKASWLPVFSQADAQKMKRLPTPSMMNDYYAASPRIFPHMCSLCNVECRHLKDWIQHQNTTAHIESCRQLRQQYPDWNPESHSSAKRREGDRKENHNVRRRSASPSPKRSRRSSSGHGRHRSRSRSPGRFRAGRRLPSPRHRSRSPRRSQDSSSWSRRSCSRERGLGRSTESPDQALEDAVKCLGPRFVEQYNRQKSLHMFSRETSGPKRMSPEVGKALGRVKKPPSAPVGPPKPSKMPAQSGSSKPFEAADTSIQGGMVADGKNKKLPLGAPTKEASVAAPAPAPAPFNRLLTEKILRCGTVLHITDLPDDGFSDHDIKKIVQPFGKVSDLLVLRSRNEAFLEMNYKEAATAAIKYSCTVPVVINRRRVKISLAERPSALLSQNKGNGKMITKTVKKPPLSTKKEQTNSAETMTKPTAPATPTPNTAKTTIKKPGEPPKEMEKEPVGAKKPGATKAPAEPKMPADAKKPEEAKKALESKKTTEPKKMAESKVKEMHKPAQVPGTTEAVKSTEAGESTVTEAEETCVVVISNLPEAGLTLDDVSSLTKPFGGLKDVLIVSSHKKAYLEISRTPAEALVKFYNCFPMWLEKNQLCFAVASEFKDVKNEEAIFVAMIKDANPKVNTETLHAQFVYLGNLPDGGYSELEILCVGLRFGRVDHYMVITNKNKAILQLDSAESAASMCRFLKRYPYSLGDSQLTFSRSPKIEPATAEVTKREVKKVEPSKESPDLKKIPEGSGVVHPAAVLSAKPIEAKEEPSSSLKAKIPEGKTVKDSVTVKMICEAPAKPLKIEASEKSCGVAATFPAGTPTDLGSSEKKLEEVLALPPKLEKDGKILDIGKKAELLENVSTSATGNGGNKSPVCAGELSEELQSKAKTESLGSDFARTEEKEEVPAAHCETVSPDSAEAPVEVSGGDLQSSSKLTSKADGSDASGNLAEMPATKIGVLIDKEAEAPFSTDEAGLKVQSWTPLGETEEAKKEKSELQMVEGEATAEKQNEVLVSDRGPTTEKKPENNANEESSEQVLQKAQTNEDTEEAQSEEPSKASTLATESTPSLAASSVSKTILKAVVSVPRITKTRTATRKKEAQKPATKMGTRSQTAAEKKPVPKEMSQQTPTSSRANVPDGSKPKLSVNSLVVKVGSGKSSSRQDKNSRMETKGSSNQTCERDSRSSSMKRDNGINKVSTGKNTRSSKSSTKSKEEEELFPFNLDEFVTVDEVTDEVDSPSQSRKNLPRAKRKEPAKKSTPSEPTLKRKKGKNSSVYAAVAELSFVTLDEIGEDEGGMAPAAELVHLGAMPDPQVLVTVDEVNEEEEQISEVVRDPQLLVTLDEISEQEESAAKGAFPLGEPDLKAGPLVTVDEIGEVEELPLSEPLHFKVDETSKPREEEKQASKDLGDFLSSQMPDDPSALVTVDEIHEDGEDQPLVTLDEVAEDDEDFLADFNRLKEELNFVTVDEVGSEDDAEEQDNIFTGVNVEKSVAGTVSAGETRMQIAEPGENVIPAKPDEAVVSAEPEVMGIPDDTLLEMRVSAGDELSEEDKSSEGHVKATEKQSSAAEINLVEATLVKAGKDEKKADLEKNKLSDIGCEQQFTEPVLNRTEWSDNKEQNIGKDQKPSESGSREEDTVMKATEMEVAGSSLSTSNEKETAGEVQMSSLDLDVSVADTRTAKADELARGSERCGRDRSIHPDASLKEESCSDVTPSQSSEKSEKGVTDSECKEPESKRRKIESAENASVSSQLKGLDFLVPKAGFFCQICSLFCVDEASMKTHCQTQLHEQNMQKFMLKNAQEEEKKDGEENAEEQSSRPAPRPATPVSSSEDEGAIAEVRALIAKHDGRQKEKQAWSEGREGQQGEAKPVLLGSLDYRLRARPGRMGASCSIKELRRCQLLWRVQVRWVMGTTQWAQCGTSGKGS